MPDSLEIPLLLIGGLVLLLLGGELLLRGGVRLAASLGMPPVLIALTVLAFGSSAPELFVCLSAAHGGASDPDQAELVLGNVLGSNICNVFFTLGATALVMPIPLDLALNTVVLVNIGVTALLVVYVTAVTGPVLGRSLGALLLAIYVAYIANALLQ